MLANRVRKNARHLGKWAKRERVTCWRVYDRDIPEVPITLDTYEGALVINDYRHIDEPASAEAATRGSTRSPPRRRPRSARPRCSSSSASDSRHREGQQYERLERRGAWRTVHEGGHAFRVNLAATSTPACSSITASRARRSRPSPAPTMLNLFAYTGSFSVYARRGRHADDHRRSVEDVPRLGAREPRAQRARPARSSTPTCASSSPTPAARAARWDVIVVDPPTFSNSKRMDYVWDVQRDHAALLDDVAAVWSGAGVIWFSTNQRRFKLDWTPPRGELVEQTHATIPPDFRDGKIHHAYRLTPPTGGRRLTVIRPSPTETLLERAQHGVGRDLDARLVLDQGDR